MKKRSLKIKMTKPTVDNKRVSQDEIEERIKTHERYAMTMIRIIRTNPNLALSATIGLSNALNQIEELEWTLGRKHDYEVITKVESRENEI